MTVKSLKQKQKLALGFYSDITLYQGLSSTEKRWVISTNTPNPLFNITIVLKQVMALLQIYFTSSRPDIRAQRHNPAICAMNLTMVWQNKLDLTGTNIFRLRKKLLASCQAYEDIQCYKNIIHTVIHTVRSSVFHH